MQADGVRTLCLSGSAYVVTCGGEQPYVDDGIVAGLTTTRSRQALYVIVDVRATRRLGLAAVGLLLDESRSLRSAGGDLWLVASDPRLLGELTSDGSCRLLCLEPTLAGAVAAVNERLVA